MQSGYSGRPLYALRAASLFWPTRSSPDSSPIVSDLSQLTLLVVEAALVADDGSAARVDREALSAH
jgi:hypothetical protein